MSIAAASGWVREISRLARDCFGRAMNILLYQAGLTHEEAGLCKEINFLNGITARVSPLSSPQQPMDHVM
jgi:hypothetical protein